MRPRERAGSEAYRATLVGALTGAVADGLDAVAGRQVLGRTQCGDYGGARGRHELAGDRCGREGDIACLA